MSETVKAEAPKITIQELEALVGPRIPARMVQHLFAPENEHMSIEAMRADLTVMANEIAGRKRARRWCQPGDVEARRWILTFEDADLGLSVFDDETEARDAFRRADEGGWNCYLFQAAERVPATPETT